MPDNTQDPSQAYGPFSGVLTGPLGPSLQQRPSQNTGYGGKPAAVALFASKFLEGAQKARLRSFAQSEAEKAQHEKNFDSYYYQSMADPNISAEGKKELTRLHQLKLGKDLHEIAKEAPKQYKDNPLLHLTRAISGAMIGPGTDPKHVDISLNSLVTTANKYRIEPAKEESQSLERILGGVQSAGGGQAPQQAPSAPQQAQQQAQQQAPQQQPPAQQPAHSSAPAPQLPGGFAPDFITKKGLYADPPPAQASPTPGTATPSASPSTPAQAQPAAPAATPPPPGTQAASEHIAAAKPRITTKAEAWDDPVFRQELSRLNSLGVPANGLLAQWYNQLRDTPKYVQPKSVTVFVPGPDGKPTTRAAINNESGILVDPATMEPIPNARIATAGELSALAKPTKPSAETEKKQNLINAFVAIGKTPEDAEKEWAKITTKTAENKASTKITDEDKFARYYLDSGKAKTEDEARKMAATGLINLQSAKIKASQNGGSASPFTPAELSALARWSINTGTTPSFGLGANNPNRVAFQRELAHQVSGDDSGENALNARSDYKADTAALTNMQRMRSNVGSFEGAANKALDNAVAQSRKVPRDSAALVNGWDQYLTKKTVDDPELQKLIVFTDTAANEYARIIGSLTGASTDAARAQANEFIRAQLGQKSFEGAADAMRTDMRNRTQQIDETINGLRSSITKIGKSGSKQTTPAPAPSDPNTPDPSKVKDGAITLKNGERVAIGSKRVLQDGKTHTVLGMNANGDVITDQ